MPALTLVAKAALPVLMLAGGGVAWASSGGAAEPTGVARAWVDSPMDGERLVPGTISVRAHASAPGGVTRIELDVDGRTVAEQSAGTDDRLGVVTLGWEAGAGVHELRVRGESAQGWSDYSSTVTVQVGEPDAVPTTALASTTTTTAVAPTTVAETTTSTTIDASTTTAVAPTTTRPGAPRTTAPAPSATAAPPGPGATAPATTAPPSGPATTNAPGTTAPPTTAYPTPTVTASGPSTAQYAGIPVTLGATGSASGRPFSLVISVANTPGGNMIPIKTCTSSPCSVSRTFNDPGTYQYFATITVGGVGTQSASKSVQIKLIG